MLGETGLGTPEKRGPKVYGKREKRRREAEKIANQIHNKKGTDADENQKWGGKRD